ncbi:MAG: hypothetical protein AAF656_13115 [Planctomycetota bacterium]
MTDFASFTLRQLEPELQEHILDEIDRLCDRIETVQDNHQYRLIEARGDSPFTASAIGLLGELVFYLVLAHPSLSE